MNAHGKSKSILTLKSSQATFKSKKQSWYRSPYKQVREQYHIDFVSSMFREDALGAEQSRGGYTDALWQDAEQYERSILREEFELFGAGNGANSGDATDGRDLWRRGQSSGFIPKNEM